MFSKLLNGAWSPANCAKKIAGPLTVFIRADSRNSTEHLIMFCPGVHKFPRRSGGLVLVGYGYRAGKSDTPGPQGAAGAILSRGGDMLDYARKPLPEREECPRRSP